jgi:hypothetical protein
MSAGKGGPARCRKAVRPALGCTLPTQMRTATSPLFVTIFFGMANFLGDIGFGPAGRNPEWPYISSPPFSLAGGASTNQAFSYQVPSGIPLGTYTGNPVLWRGDSWGVGAYLDRGLFWVTVT